ncbi:hypothetical protein M0R04_07510 [Candidatus Dojkabacteria bacterium]|jgi:hypothetical protein|nr:hypothetical protein [Candidatus Dojkabacteria bacterium]
MSYKLVSGGINHLARIENEVNLMIDLGWEVVGELKTATAEGQTVFVQQMKYTNHHQPTNIPSLLTPKPVLNYPFLAGDTIPPLYVVGDFPPQQTGTSIDNEPRGGCFDPAFKSTPKGRDYDEAQ